MKLGLSPFWTAHQSRNSVYAVSTTLTILSMEKNREQGDDYILSYLFSCWSKKYYIVHDEPESSIKK